MTNGAPTTNPPAFLLYATTGDHVPYSQADDMWMALNTRYSTLAGNKYIMTYGYGSGYEHAFHYWHQINNDPLNTDGDQ